MIYAILLFGLDIVVGYTGQVSLGHAGLFGVGAYTAGVLFIKLGMPLLVTAPLAILVTAGFGAILALPALRVSGPYLAMVTLAFGTIIQILINEMDLSDQRADGRQDSEARRSAAGSTSRVLLARRGAAGGVADRRASRAAVASRPRVRGAARQPDRVGLHGRLGVPLQGLRVRDQRGFRRTGGLPVFVFGAVHLAEHLQLRADRSCSCSRSSWAAARRAPARCSARRSSCCCPNCSTTSTMFRKVASVLAGWSS